LLLRQRRRRLVVFGTYGRRLEVYRRSAQNLRRVCGALEIEEVLDIGRPLEGGVIPDLGAPVVTCGELPGAGVGEVLTDSVAGVVDYPVSILAKSTIFAAYCAHRLIPLVAAYGDGARMDGLEPNKHYRLVDDDIKGLNLPAGQAIADNAHGWYQTHNLAVHAKALASRLTANNGNSKESRATHAEN
jgi:hypothetical protein